MPPTYSPFLVHPYVPSFSFSLSLSLRLKNEPSGARIYLVRERADVYARDRGEERLFVAVGVGLRCCYSKLRRGLVGGYVCKGTLALGF